MWGTKMITKYLESRSTQNHSLQTKDPTIKVEDEVKNEKNGPVRALSSDFTILGSPKRTRTTSF